MRIAVLLSSPQRPDRVRLSRQPAWSGSGRRRATRSAAFRSRRRPAIRRTGRRHPPRVSLAAVPSGVRHRLRYLQDDLRSTREAPRLLDHVRSWRPDVFIARHSDFDRTLDRMLGAHGMPGRRRGERGGPSRVAPPARRGTAGQCGRARAGLPASRRLQHLRVGGGPARAARARRGSRALRRRAERRGLRAVQARGRVGRRAEGVAGGEKRPARGLLWFSRHGPRHGHAAPRHRAARRARARQPVPLRRAGRGAGGRAPAASPAPRRPRAT